MKSLCWTIAVYQTLRFIIRLAYGCGVKEWPRKREPMGVGLYYGETVESLAIGVWAIVALWLEAQV